MNNVLFLSSMIEPKGGLLSLPIIIMAAFPVFAIVLMFAIIDVTKNTSISLTDSELIIRSSFYSKKIPLENIIADDVRAVNLDVESGYDIFLRMGGTNLPGLNLGRARLKNGAKALMFVTDRTSVALIPSNDYLILFSMNNIEEFAARLRATKK